MREVLYMQGLITPHTIIFFTNSSICSNTFYAAGCCCTMSCEMDLPAGRQVHQLLISIYPEYLYAPK